MVTRASDLKEQFCLRKINRAGEISWYAISSTGISCKTLSLTLFPCTIWTFPPNLITNIFNLKSQMNRRKGERPKIYPEVTPLPTEAPVGGSKLRFVRSNVNEFYAFI